MKNQMFELIVFWLCLVSFSQGFALKEKAFSLANELKEIKETHSEKFHVNLKHNHHDHSIINNDELIIEQNDGKKHKCQHNKINQVKTQGNVQYNNHPYDNERRSLQSSSYESIRITPYWDQVELDLKHNASTLAYVKQLVSTSFNFFEEMIKVHRVDGNLYVPRMCYQWYPINGYIDCIEYNNECGHVTVPASHLDSGWLYYYPDNYSATELPQGNGIVDTDLVIYITANDSTCEDGVLAWATACSLDQYGRPVAGTINFCASSLATSDWRQDVDVTIHELTHVLVMSPGLWDYFRNDDGSIKNVSDVYKTVENTTYIITDKVKESAQTHYNCSSLIGLPVEDDGSEGSAGSHWEEHYVRSEYMCAVIYSSLTYVSDFTLSLMEDSGWYQVDYSYSEPFVYGKNEGCSFFADECINNNEKSNYPDYYCDSISDDGCTYDNSAVGYCMIMTQDTIPSDYNYFSDSTGGSEYSEYCPFRISVETTPGWINVCWDARGNSIEAPSIDYPVNYSMNSRCVETKNDNGVKKGYCFNHECYNYNSNSGLWSGVYIYIGSEVIDCTRLTQGQFKYSSIQNLNITCPFIDQICITSKPFECQWGYYDNTNSKCVCSPGYTGTYCTITDNSTVVSGVVLGQATTEGAPYYCSNVTISNNDRSYLNGIYKFDGLLHSDTFPSYKYDEYYLYYNIFIHKWLIAPDKTTSSYYSYCESESETIWGIEDDCTWVTYISGAYVDDNDLTISFDGCTMPTEAPDSQGYSLYNCCNSIAFIVTIILSIIILQ